MINGEWQPSCDGTSRLNREVHVRFCERLGVQFPGLTRRLFAPRSLKGTTALLPYLNWILRRCFDPRRVFPRKRGVL
jgi:hypothetical protein